MTLKRTKALLVALALGGIPLVTTATCDPRAGALDFFRDDDDYGLYDAVYYDDWYYEDYYYDPYYYDPYYYDPYYDDCLFCF